MHEQDFAGTYTIASGLNRIYESSIYTCIWYVTVIQNVLYMHHGCTYAIHHILVFYGEGYTVIQRGTERILFALKPVHADISQASKTETFGPVSKSGTSNTKRLSLGLGVGQFDRYDMCIDIFCSIKTMLSRYSYSKHLVARLYITRIEYTVVKIINDINLLPINHIYRLYASIFRITRVCLLCNTKCS